MRLGFARVFLECLIDKRKNKKCDRRGSDEPSDDDCGQRPLNLCSRALGQKKGHDTENCSECRHQDRSNF